MEGKIFSSDILGILGPSEDRYFSNGFRAVDISYNDMNWNGHLLASKLIVSYNAGWSKKRGNNLAPHLGTTEFIAIAAVIGRKLLERQMHLSELEIGNAWIKRVAFKVRKCMESSCDSIPVSGRIVSTDNIHKDRYQSDIRVNIGLVSVTLYIAHGISSENTMITESKESDFYQDGYKSRKHFIRKVLIDPDEKHAISNVSVIDKSINKCGIGTSYPGVVLTDFALITGQITQALLLTINNTSRETSNNLWLREIDIWAEEPSKTNQCECKIEFQKVHNINKDNELWQSVLLSGSLGTMRSKIKVAHRLN